MFPRYFSGFISFLKNAGVHRLVQKVFILKRQAETCLYRFKHGSTDGCQQKRDGTTEQHDAATGTSTCH